MSAIVDLQGFKKPTNKFVLKEVAILKDGMTQPLVYQFFPPFPWHDLPPEYKRENAWLERHYIGLKWNSGTLPYNDVEETLHSHLKDVDVIYVKGSRKAQWLRSLVGVYRYVIEDLEEEDCPSIQQLTKTCFYHPKKFVCAAENAIAIAQWVASKSVEKPSTDRSIRLFHKTGSLMQFTTADLACLPKSFLLLYCGHLIDQAWPRLPGHMKDDSEIAGYRRCHRHYPKNGDVWDGPPQMIKDCYTCQKRQS